MYKGVGDLLVLFLDLFKKGKGKYRSSQASGYSYLLVELDYGYGYGYLLDVTCLLTLV